MFGWITNRRQRRQRHIYRYWDGSRDVLADPMRILRSLHSQDNLEDDMKLAMLSDDPVGMDSEAARKHAKRKLAAAANLVEAARQAFGVKEFSYQDDGTTEGLTEGELLDLLDDFGAFVSDQKKSGRPTPTSPPATGPPGCPPVTTPGNDTSACGSTESGQKSEKPSRSSAPC